MKNQASAPTALGRSARVRRRGQGLAAAAFLLPLGLFYAVYYVYSFAFLGTISMQKVSLSFINAVDVGWRNYVLLLTDQLFLTALINNLIFSVVSIAAALTLGFLIAMLLAVGVPFKQGFYVIFLLPSLLPLALFATVFGKMLGTQYGEFNGLLRAVGLGALQQDWLGEPGPAYAAVFVLLVYLIGLPIMYYYSDVEAIDLSLIEAAVIDGAGAWRIFRVMLFPLLRGTHKTVILAVLLASFRAFDVIYFSTKGGPAGATAITGTYLYTKTLSVGPTIGYAAAASVVILVIAVAISGIQILVTRRGDA